jgi:glucose-1-phosphate thymidylyltransferase
VIGIIPAAGAGERIQPLGCSKELLPVGSQGENNTERPKAVAEYLVERMLLAGADQICMVISAEKTDIFRYFAKRSFPAEIFYVVQPRPAGLCDALFRALPFTRAHDEVLIGLPDTIWFPENAFACALDFSRAPVNLGLFPVEDASQFDAVVTSPNGMAERVEVKIPRPSSQLIWGAVTASSRGFSGLHDLWQRRECADAYFGDLLNSYMDHGSRVGAIAVGEHYMDVGTLAGFHAAQDYLRARSRRKKSQPVAA